MSSINPDIFHAYDVRGIYPEQVNSISARAIGRAFVRFLKKSSGKDKLKVVIGRDNRNSSSELSGALKEGILSEGADIVDIGQSPSPMFYFGVWHYGYDGGVQVTASHNPPQFNGFKIVREKAIMIGKNAGLNEIKEVALSLTDEELEEGEGKIEKKDILEDYVKFNLGELDKKKLKPLKIAIDTGNAVSGILIPELKKHLPLQIHHLFPELDGSFPNHAPNPLEEENVKDLKNFIKENDYDLGLAFDGDGDRIIFISETGEIIPSDYITCLISEALLKDNPGAKILYNVCSSNVIKDIVEENKGVALHTRIGHTFVKQRMKKEEALFGGEFSGHFYLKSHPYGEVPLAILFKILMKISENEKPISKLLISFKKYFHSGQKNLEVEDKNKTLQLLEDKYKEGEISHLDGLRVDFDNWWFNARPSNTEDLLRIVVEAKNDGLMKEKFQEILNLAKEN